MHSVTAHQLDPRAHRLDRRVEFAPVGERPGFVGVGDEDEVGGGLRVLEQRAAVAHHLEPGGAIAERGRGGSERGQRPAFLGLRSDGARNVQPFLRQFVGEPVAVGDELGVGERGERSGSLSATAAS